MKRIFAIFSAFLLLFNVLGSIIVFLIFKSPVVNSPVQRSRNSGEVKISIIRLAENRALSRETIIFRDDNEIKFNGKMFDIITSMKADDTLFIYCIEDKAESNILNAIGLCFSETGDNFPDGKIINVSLRNIIQDGIAPGQNEFPKLNSEENFKDFQNSPVCFFSPEIIPPPPRA